MFSRRRRAPSNPALNGSNANPAATTAATSAFLKSQASNASLSSAAAAAALRSRPTTPISVADVQTKRTLRRSGSTSSIGSSVNGSQRGGRPSLERRGSSGSMTERTFRDPSPGRPVPSAADAPPVPAIPQNIPSTGSLKAHRRAASLEAPPMRIASPPPNQATGRGSSLGPGTETATPRRAQRSSNLSSVSELTSDSRRGSVNYSYPTTLRPASPLSQRRLTSLSPLRNNQPRINSPTNQNLIYDPNTRSFLPAAEIHAIEHRLYEATNASVKTKKRTPPGNATGSHLAQGTVGGRPRGTAIDAMDAAAKQPPQPVSQSPVVQSQPLPSLAVELPAESTATSQGQRRKKKRVVINDSDSDQASYLAGSSDNDSDVPNSRARFGTMLVKKPSVVREDREREEIEDDTPQRIQPAHTLSVGASFAGRDISPTPLPRSKAGRGHGGVPEPATLSSDQVEQKKDEDPTGPSNHGLPAPAPIAEAPGLPTNGTAPVARMPSVSPGRSAHFAAAPDSLVVKHNPPQRSISPRKSALKHSNSRGSSPVAATSSEASNSPAALEDQLSVPRKKSVRVSFDETNVGIGQAAATILSDSPIAQSPQVTKRPWYSIARGKKKEQAAADEDDEIMKPRPALPSFGSVRERKHREVEERPLVTPSEPIEARQPVPSPLFTSPTGEIIENPLGLSKDHAVGAVLAQDASTKNTANISKSREPLPPQVTSVEGSGYHSDTDSSVSATETSTPASASTEPEVNHKLQEETSVDKEKTVPNSGPDRDEDASTPTQEKSPDVAIPQIAVSQASPTLDETPKKEPWPNVPGGWESSTTSDSSNETPRASLDDIIEAAPSTSIFSEPNSGMHTHESLRSGLGHHHQMTPAILEESEESDADVYTDAAEDLSDVGDGFQSLDAVVESPVVDSAPGLAITTPPESPTARTVKERAFQKNVLSKKSSAPDLEEGWEKAQEYWKGLTADKKRQLELEAMEEADDGSDTEVEVKPAPKQKVRNKVVKPVPAPINVSNERTYMIQPGSRAGPAGHTTMRSSMRTEPPNPVVDTQMRKSMRSQQEQPQGTMRASMRAPPISSVQKQARPVSLPADLKTGPVAGKHVRNLSSASAAAASDAARRNVQPPAPVLRRKGSGDSDSSFKRTKPSNEMTMRRSMRGNSVSAPAERPQSPASRFSLRSLSPTGSFSRPSFSSTPAASGQNHMRSSLRGNQAPTPTLRGLTPTRSKSPSAGMKLPGFGRSNKNVKSQKPVRARSSRFADSSDDDDERPTFRSRFVDSSDDSDDEPMQKSTTMRNSMRNSATARAVPSGPPRGIPKPSGVEDGDSSDLADSDDEKATSPGIRLLKKRAPNGTPVTAGGQGGALASGSLRRSGSGRGTLEMPANTTTVSAAPMRPTQKRRSSIMSILRRKKDDTAKVRKSDAESPARRDTPLERSKQDLQALRNDQPTPPRLQKRNPLSRENSGQWPLKNLDTQPRVEGNQDGRPFTADAGNGVAGPEAKFLNDDEAKDESRPDIGTRRFTATGMGAVDFKSVNGTASGDAKKKKKFGALRKLFKLDD